MGLMILHHTMHQIKYKFEYYKERVMGSVLNGTIGNGLSRIYSFHISCKFLCTID